MIEGRQEDEDEAPGERHGSGGVRALLRGLEILRYVNATGSPRPGQIARALNIPRPTVYRLLETLEAAGYVAFSTSANVVRVTRLAATLGDGSATRSELCRAAAPLFAEFGRKLVWPLDLSTYDNAAMVVQETTHGQSPLSIDRGMAGSRLPVLRTSQGRAYIAFCSDAERNLIIEHLRRNNDPGDAPFLKPGWLEQTIAETRERGYALRDRGEFRSHTASLAVPVFVAGSLRACVSMIWIRSAIDTRKAVETGAPALQDLAARLAQRLA